MIRFNPAMKKLPNSTVPIISGRSRLSIALNAWAPIPGQAKTCSTAITPPRKQPRSRPSSVHARRKAIEDQGQHGRATHVGLPKVELGHARDVAAVLLPDRAVEPHLLPDLFERSGVGPLAGDRQRRIGRDDERKDEGKGRHAPEDE